MMSGKIGTVMLLCLGLAACEKDVQLQGERIPVTVPLADTAPVDGKPAPALPGAPANRVVAISLPAPVSNAEWTHRGGSARHAGPDGMLSATPQLVWSQDVGAKNSRRNRISAAPVVSNGRVFAMDAKTTVAAFTTGGAPLWSVDLKAGYDAKGEISGGGLAVEGGRLFATTGYGELIALDVTSGAILWRKKLGSPITGAPTVSGKAVYAIGRDGSAMAASVETGKQLWQVPGAPDASGVVGASSPSVGDGEILFPFPSGEIAAINPAGGERSWGAAVAGQRPGRAYAFIGDLTGEPVVVGGTIYAGTAAGRTVAIEAASGRRIWATGEGALNPPLVVGGSVFVVNDQAKLVRMDARTGEVIWKIEMPYYVKDKPKKQIEIYAHYGPVLAGRRIVVASSDGFLRSFDAASGALVSAVEIPGGAASSPALAQGMLFVMGGDGQLHAFR